MLLVETILLSFALIIDSFTISVSFGLVDTRKTIVKNMNVVGIVCALGQAMFLTAGWAAGLFIGQFIGAIGPWTGFFLLTGLSVFMIVDAMKKKADPAIAGTGNVFSLKTIIFLVVATSFDVLSVGITLGLVQEGILLLILFVFVLTYLSAYAGGFTGLRIGEKIGIYKGQILGAVLLFLLGLNLLLQNV